jgi:hypothetical protein
LIAAGLPFARAITPHEIPASQSCRKPNRMRLRDAPSAALPLPGLLANPFDVAPTVAPTGLRRSEG